jgi:hypothetical protein
MLYQGGRGLEILTMSLTVQVSAIAVGVGVGAVVAIAIGGGKELRGSTHGGQHSQQGDKKNELKHTCLLSSMANQSFHQNKEYFFSSLPLKTSCGELHFYKLDSGD